LKPFVVCFARKTALNVEMSLVSIVPERMNACCSITLTMLTPRDSRMGRHEISRD
jgi:hypothetical protein